MARHLEIRGVPVEVLIFHDPQEDSGDAATNFRILRRSDVPIHQLSLPADRVQLEKHLQRASWVVDALLGTGARGPARFPYDLIIDRINAAGRPVFAIDLPSGLDCDLGDPAAHCVRATLTATLVAAKPGFLAPAGKAHVGEVHVLDIGVPRTVLAALHGGADEEAEPETG
jgi:NAD(P)H-hydrate epimerase